MKYHFYFLFLFSQVIISQNITGDWYGSLNIQGFELPLVFHISNAETGYKATMDSPDQKAFGIPVSSVSYENNLFELKVEMAAIYYKGSLKDDSLDGTFTQSGKELPLKLGHKASEKKIVVHPQEPKKPYPYYTEDITFTNPKAAVTLAGTLTLPNQTGKYPAVILITGSGAQNRDEELLGHKPFLVLADYLTRNGIAVLRFDDRGFGSSTGDFKTATSADFATDVESAFAYLKNRKEIISNKIGLMGHSEGGIIAPMVSSENKDVAFIVLLAGTGIQGNELLLLQQKLIAKAGGLSDEMIDFTEKLNKKVFDFIISTDKKEVKLKESAIKMITDIIKNTPKELKPNGVSDEEIASQQTNELLNPWMLYFLRYNPAPTLEKVKCPVLAVNGEKDLQVPPKENLTAIEKALNKGGNKKVTIHEFPKLNHLFQECTTGSPTEYATIEQTFSPTALDYVTQWIVNQTK